MNRQEQKKRFVFWQVATKFQLTHVYTVHSDYIDCTYVEPACMHSIRFNKN